MRKIWKVKRVVPRKGNECLGCCRVAREICQLFLCHQKENLHSGPNMPSPWTRVRVKSPHPRGNSRTFFFFFFWQLSPKPKKKKKKNVSSIWSEIADMVPKNAFCCVLRWFNFSCFWMFLPLFGTSCEGSGLIRGRIHIWWMKLSSYAPYPNPTKN